AVLELGVIPGGYGWIFPKRDHLNVGVIAWESEGPGLRSHLDRLLVRHGLERRTLEDTRGYRLPVRDARAPFRRGAALLVGDAAGLADPLSGDGIFEAAASARIAAEQAVAGTLDRYEREVVRSIGPLCAAAWDGKLAFDRYPRLAYAIARTPPAWRIVAALLRGDIADPGELTGLR